jgi:hypothetical protein
MKLVMVNLTPSNGDAKDLMIERKDGTIVKFTDNGFETLDAGLKRIRHYDWKDLEIMNDAIRRITDVRKKKK